MKRFTVVLDESGSPHFPPNEQDRYFSVGLLCPEDPDALRSVIITARSACPDERVKRRGFFHASEDGRKTHEFLAQQLHGNSFILRCCWRTRQLPTNFTRSTSLVISTAYW